ncbi:unnamed protein product [Sphagnum tenellum]
MDKWTTHSCWLRLQGSETLLGLEYDEPRCREEHHVYSIHTTNFQVLRRVPASYLRGWSCQVQLTMTRSCPRWVYHYLRGALAISPDHCHTIWKFRIYQDPLGNRHPLTLDENRIDFSQLEGRHNNTCCEYLELLTLGHLTLRQVQCIDHLDLLMKDEAFLPHNAYFSNDGLQVRLLIIGQATACGRTLLTTNDPDLFLRNADEAAPFRWEAPLPDVSISLINPLSSDFYLGRQTNGSYRQDTVKKEFQHVMNSHCRNAGSGFILNLG